MCDIGLFPGGKGMTSAISGNQVFSLGVDDGNVRFSCVIDEHWHAREISLSVGSHPVDVGRQAWRT